MKKSIKISLWSLATLLVVTAAWFVFIRKEKQSTLTLLTKTVDYGDIVNSVTATGTLEPLVTVEVGTQVSGEIDKIYVDYGSVVKKGQILAELDRSNLTATLVSSKANYESAQNELNYQKSNYDRISTLYEKQSVTKTDFETATYQYNNAKYAFVRAKSDMEKAQTNLGYATLYSPIDGVVLSRSVDEGQTVAASFSTPTMFTIAKDLTKMRVIADVDEADIGNVRVNQHVTFTVDAFPNDEFTGTVTTIRLEAQVASNVVTYEVVIDAPNPEQKLLPGLTASVNIMTQEKRNVLIIPSKAQRVQPTAEALALANGTPLEEVSTPTEVTAPEKPGGPMPPKDQSMGAPKSKVGGLKAAEGGSNKRTVWIKNKAGKVEQRSIQIGATDGISTEVLSGLEKGEEVVTELSVSSPLDETEKASSPFMPRRPGQNRR